MSTNIDNVIEVEPQPFWTTKLTTRDLLDLNRPVADVQSLESAVDAIDEANYPLLSYEERENRMSSRLQNCIDLN